MDMKRKVVTGDVFAIGVHCGQCSLRHHIDRSAWNKETGVIVEMKDEFCCGNGCCFPCYCSGARLNVSWKCPQCKTLNAAELLI